MAWLGAGLAAVGGWIGSAASAVGSAAGVGGGATAAGGASSALSLGATALSAGGAVASALAENQAAKYNARISEEQARQATEQAALRASELERRNRQALAAARAATAQNGLELNGSVGDLIFQMRRQGDADVLAAVYDGSVARAGLLADSNLSRQRGRSSLTSGLIGAGSQALGGLSNIYDTRTRRSAV